MALGWAKASISKTREQLTLYSPTPNAHTQHLGHRFTHSDTISNAFPSLERSHHFPLGTPLAETT